MGKTFVISIIIVLQGAETDGVVRLSVADEGGRYTENVFLDPVIAQQFTFQREKAYAVRFLYLALVLISTRIYPIPS